MEGFKLERRTRQQRGELLLTHFDPSNYKSSIYSVRSNKEKEYSEEIPHLEASSRRIFPSFLQHRGEQTGPPRAAWWPIFLPTNQAPG